jgi:hypothetical protein
LDRAVESACGPPRFPDLHPNDLGMQAMANAIPLQLFRSLGNAAGSATPTASTAAAARVSQR